MSGKIVFIRYNFILFYHSLYECCAHGTNYISKIIRRWTVVKECENCRSEKLETTTEKNVFLQRHFEPKHIEILTKASKNIPNTSDLQQPLFTTSSFSKKTTLRIRMHPILLCFSKLLFLFILVVFCFCHFVFG